jgi:preprotein translocase subunit SecA
VVGRFRDAVYTARNDILRDRLPPGFEKYPPAMAKAVLLAGIDEAWAAFLEETEAAKDRTEIVSMAGKNYEIEFIRDIAGMYREMQNAVRETAYGRLDRLKNGAENVGNL